MITATLINRFCSTILLAVLFAMLNPFVHRHYFLPPPTQFPTSHEAHSMIVPQSDKVCLCLSPDNQNTLRRDTSHILL
jgi:hypothetical protein